MGADTNQWGTASLYYKCVNDVTYLKNYITVSCTKSLNFNGT
jgi:hypothetical protein